MARRDAAHAKAAARKARLRDLKVNTKPVVVVSLVILLVSLL